MRDGLAEHVVIDIGMRIDMDQPDRPVTARDGPQHRQRQRMIAAKRQRNDVMRQHAVIEVGDPCHRILEIEGIDRHVAKIADTKRIKRRGTGPHIIGTQHHRLGADLLWPEPRSRPVRGADIQRDADEDGIHAGGTVDGGKAHHCSRAGKAWHVVATKRLREIRRIVIHLAMLRCWSWTPDHNRAACQRM